MKLLIILLLIPFTNYSQTPHGNALKFDGVDDYITTPSNSLLTNASFTIEFWAKRESLGAWDLIFSQGVESPHNGLHIGFRASNQFTFGFYANDLNTPIYSDTDWHHWAMTYDTGTNNRKIYRDGIVVASDSPLNDYAGSGVFNIGCFLTGLIYINGSIDELRIWNDARTITEIQNNKDINIDPTSAGLLSYYTFDQGDAGNDNSALTNELVDYTGCNKGTLNNMARSGATSNWISTGNDEAPVLATTAIGDPSQIMQLTGNIFSIGQSTVTTRGFCYSTNDCPTITNNLINESGSYSSGSYSLSITSELTNGVTYYARAYATNSKGTSYGETMSFVPARSNTGPGGVGLTDGTSTLEFWIDANNGTSTTTDGANISQWSDQSGNGIDVTQGTAGNQPSYEDDGTNALNGYPVVHFDNNDELLSATTTLNITNDFTIFLVKKDNTTQPGSNSDYFSLGAYGAYGIKVYRGDNINDKFIVKSSGPWVGDYVGSSGVTNNATYIGEYKRSGTSTSISRLGNAYITDVGTAGPLEYGTTPIISIGSSIATNYLQGNIAEQIAFSNAVNTAQKIIIENYLAAKYGTVLGTNDIYDADNVGNGDYDHDVAGIGRVDASNLHNDAQGTGSVRIFNPTDLGDDEFLFWGHNDGVSFAYETTDVPVGTLARYVREWRVSESNAAGTAVDVGAIDIRFDLTGHGTMTASDLVLLIDTDNDGIFSDETAISGAISNGSGLYTFVGVTAVTDNVRFTIGTINTTQTPLPVELLDFIASTDDNKVISLDWQTASENNNDFFTLERSNDNENWTELEKIDGATNSTTLLSYNRIDHNPEFGLNYYRLKQTNFDGYFIFSQIQAVQINRFNDNHISIYPNPTLGQTTISGSTDELSEIQIFSSVGQNVTRFVKLLEFNDTKVVFDLSELKRGIYLIKTKTMTKRVSLE